MSESAQLRTIRLYGKLGAKFGRKFQLAVNSPAEAVRALCAQLDGFERHMVSSKDRNEGYAVFIGKTNLEEDELDYPAGNDDIRIAPMLFGSKKAGFFNIILGAVIVVIGAVVGMWFAPAGALIVKAGVSMMIGGVVQMLMPGPKQGGSSEYEKGKNKPSYIFNGAVNTQAQGHPTPLLYGRMITGSAVVSAGISAEEVYIPTPSGGSGGGFQGGTGVIEYEQ